MVYMLKSKIKIAVSLLLTVFLTGGAVCNNVGASPLAITAVEWGTNDTYVSNYQIIYGYEYDTYITEYTDTKILTLTYLYGEEPKKFVAPSGFKIIGFSYSVWRTGGFYYVDNPDKNYLVIATDGGFNYQSSYSSMGLGQIHWFFEYPSNYITVDQYFRYTSQPITVNVMDATVYMVPSDSSLTFSLSQVDKDKIDSAKTAATSAHTAASGAKLSADNAKSEATLAKNAATNANTAANNAITAANNAKSSADTAASRSWDVTEGKSVATLAKEARDKAQDVATKLNSIEVDLGDKINQIEYKLDQSDEIPPNLDLSWLNRKTATKSGSEDLFIKVSDNRTPKSLLKYEIKINETVIVSETVGVPDSISLPLGGNGIKVVNVRIIDENGNEVNKEIQIWKL